MLSAFFFFFFIDTATTEIYTLSLHDALPIYVSNTLSSHMWWSQEEWMNQILLIRKIDGGISQIYQMILTTWS